MKQRALLHELPLSAQIVYKVLRHHKGLSTHEISENTPYSLRTIQYALRHLKDTHLVRQHSDVQDLRRYKYSVIS